MIKIALSTGLAALLALGAACSRNADANASAASSPQSTTAQHSTKTVAIEVTDQGFAPSTVHASVGQPLVLNFKRTSDSTCAREVVFPELSITKPLPLNETVTVEIPTKEARELAFQCGMGMYRSSVMIH